MDSRRELIMKDIHRSLEKIRIPNGYQTDITTIRRWDQDYNPFKDTPLIYIVADDEEKNDENAYPEVNCRLNVILEFWFRHDKDLYPQPTDEILSLFLADIEKAVMQDNTRGGNAITTYMRGNSPFEVVQGGNYSGFLIKVEVFYKHHFSDPYT